MSVSNEVNPVDEDCLENGNLLVYTMDTDWGGHEGCPKRYWQISNNTIRCLHCGLYAPVRVLEVPADKVKEFL